MIQRAKQMKYKLDTKHRLIGLILVSGSILAEIILLTAAR